MRLIASIDPPGSSQPRGARSEGCSVPMAGLLRFGCGIASWLASWGTQRTIHINNNPILGTIPAQPVEWWEQPASNLVPVRSDHLYRDSAMVEIGTATANCPLGLRGHHGQLEPVMQN